MRTLITLLIFLPTALLAQDRAKDILDNVSQKTSSYSTIEAHFTNSIVSKTAGINESQKGNCFYRVISIVLRWNLKLLFLMEKIIGSIY